MLAVEGCTVRHAVTVAELERWREHGATWRLLELTDSNVELELCTCSGEPVDRVHSADPGIVRYLRAHPTEEFEDSADGSEDGPVG